MRSGQDRAWERAFIVCILVSAVLVLVLPADAVAVTPANPWGNDVIAIPADTPQGDGFSLDPGDGSTGTGNLTGSVAAGALAGGRYRANIGIALVSLQFRIEDPYIRTDVIGDRCAGDKFTITAQTNLAVDDEVLFEVYSSSFKPTQKSQSGEFSGATGTVRVKRGDTGMNKLLFDVDTATFKPDEYIVRVSAVIQDATGTALFRVIECPITTTPTPVTTIPTPFPTTRPPVTTFPTPVIKTCPPDCPPPDRFPWIFLIVLLPLGYVAYKAHIRAQAIKHCPKVSPSVRIDGGLGMEDDPPGCLNTSVRFSGGVEDDEGRLR